MMLLTMDAGLITLMLRVVRLSVAMILQVRTLQPRPELNQYGRGNRSVHRGVWLMPRSVLALLF